MTMARSRLVQVEVTRYYHCISRCVRKAMLCGKGYEHRKQWIEDRLKLLTGSFSIGVGGFSVMNNHLHVLVRLEPERSDDWEAEEVVRRWIGVYAPRELDLDDPIAVQDYVHAQTQKPGRVAIYRARLANLGWFMKALKEPLARMANKEDDCRGTFWESRYKSIAVLDEEAILATCAYIDLNPMAAGISTLPENSKHTSIRQRVAHIRSKKQGVKALKAAHQATEASRLALGKLEDDHWLCPIQDRRTQGSKRSGMVERLSLASYLMLVDYTSRLFRPGKTRVKAQEKKIFERLGTSADIWGERLQRLFGNRRISGTYFTTDRSRLRELAPKHGCQRLANLAGCPA